MKNYTSVCDYLASARPSDPVICHRPHAARHSAIYFQDKFPGDVLYAVKANPSPLIIGELYAAGIRSFDVASIAEITLLSGYPGVSLHCMHPVKHPEHIRRAYHEFGVRSFALDSSDELEKICQVTANATDLALHVRIAVDNSASRIPLNGKFGVGFAETYLWRHGGALPDLESVSMSVLRLCARRTSPEQSSGPAKSSASQV
jgi:ornithine decarboxylase